MLKHASRSRHIDPDRPPAAAGGLRSQVPDLVHGPRELLETAASCSRLLDENGPAPSTGGRRRASTWQLQLSHWVLRATYDAAQPTTSVDPAWYRFLCGRPHRVAAASYVSHCLERAVQVPEMSIAPGFVLIRLWGRDRRPGAGGRLAPRARAEPATGERRGTWSKAGSKQGVCPAPTSSHAIPAHQPGHKHHSSGSPHPDTRGWGQTATPGRQLPHSEDGQRSPPL